MSGPSLQLGISGTGVDTLVRINEQLGLLRTNLTSLKGSGKADLSGLTSAATELRGMRAQLAEQNAGLRTSFAELAEAIKGGLTQAATETTNAGAKLRSAVARERQGMQLEYEAMLKQGRDFSLAELNVIKDAGVKLTSAQAARVQEQSRLNAALKPDLSKGSVSNPKPDYSSDSEIEAAWAVHDRTLASRISATKEQAWTQAETASQERIGKVQMQSAQGFAAIEKAAAAERVASIESGGKAVIAGIAAAEAAVTARRAELLATNAGLVRGQQIKQGQEDAAWNARQATSSRLSPQSADTAISKENLAAEQAKISEEARGFAAMEKARSAQIIEAAAESARLEAAGIKTADAFFEAELKKSMADRKAAAVAYINAQAEKEALAKRDRELNAAYLASNEATKLRKLQGAQALTGQGSTQLQVSEKFGSQAAGLAQSIGAIRELEGRVGSTVPKLASMKGAMNDLHSAARGVASGFNAMFLTWGNLAPLLAGAALSNAFVQTVKIGSEVEQQLELIKQLSSETDVAMAGLKTRLLELASNGPQGPLEIAKAMKALSLAGLDAVQVGASVKAALNLSIVGELPAEKAAESLVGISTAFGYAAGEFNRVGDVIGKTAAISMSSVQSMTESFRVASTTSQLYGVSLEDVAVQLGLLANANIRGSAAGTAVTQFYANLTGSTRGAAQAIAALGLKVQDSAGKFKSLTEISTQLSAAQQRLGEGKFIEQLDKLLNNRGLRNAGVELAASSKAALDANGNAVLDSAGNVVSVLKKMQQDVHESFAFMAIAAANVATSSKNQLASVGAAFQGSLVRAFEDLEPAILVITKRLREAFNSTEFQGTLNGLVNSVGNLAVFLIEHANLIQIAATAWLVYKGAAIGAAVFTGLGLAVSAVGPAFTAMAVGIRAVGVALGLVQGGSIAAVAGLTAIRAVLGPVGLLIGAASAAWLLYRTVTATATASAADSVRIKSDLILESLQKEIDSISARNALLREGLTQRQADIKLASLQTQADFNSKTDKQRTGLVQAVVDVDTDLRDRERSLNQQNGQLGGGKPNLDAFKKAADAKREAAVKALDEFDQATTIKAAQVKAKAIELASVSEQAEALARKEHENKVNSDKVPTVKPDTTLLSGAKAEFEVAEAVTKKYYSDQQKLLDLSHKYKLTSDTLYAIKSEQIAEEAYQVETQFLEIYIAKSKTLIQSLRDDKKGGKADAAIAEQIKTKALLEEQLNMAKKTAEIRKQGAPVKKDLEAEAEIVKLQEGVALAQQQLVLKQSYASLTEKEIAYQEAVNASIAASAPLIKSRQEDIKKLQTDLATEAGKSNADQDTLKQLQDRIDVLQSAIIKLTDARAKAANDLGNVAAAKLEAPWEKMLEGYKNTAQQMKTAYDEMVTGFITEGEKMWTTFLKGGKVSIDGLVNLVGDIVFKQVYQQQIAPFFAELGQKTASLAGFNPGGKNGPGASVSPVDSAASGTAVSLKTLQTAGISPVTSGLQQMLFAIEAATSKMWQMSGSSGSGWSAAVTKLFSGEGGNYSHEGNNAPAPVDGGYGGDDGIAFAANGNTFGQYAKGDVFTNKVYSQPTQFHFKNGGGFSQGELGEAGPEAVMPLKRTANGSLGVAVTGSGGGGGSAPVNVVIQNNTGEKATVQKSTRADGSQEIKAIIGAAVQETAKSISNNGVVANAVQSQYGMSRANGLPRR